MRLLRVGLLGRLRAIERVELHAIVEHAHRYRVGREVAVIALRIEDLRHQAAVGHGGRIAVAEPSRAGPRKIGLQLGEPVGDPVPVPVVDLLLRLAERALQMLQHAQIVERMDLAGDEVGERAHARACDRLARQERWYRMPFLQPLDDGERLHKAPAIVELEGGQQRLRIHFDVLALTMLALRKVHEHRLVTEALQIERNANAKGCGAAEVRVELHNAGAILTLSSVTPSMPARSSSPGLTGPTPAGGPGEMRVPRSSGECSGGEANCSR